MNFAKKSAQWAITFFGITMLVSTAHAQALPNAELLDQPPRVDAATNCPKLDKWSTPAEKSCYRTTPRYDETRAYAERLAQAAPTQVRIESFGRTGEGRDLYAIIVSRDGDFDPAKLHAAKRPVVYIQNAIHAGEMDGKDASLALVRDTIINKSQAALIERVVLVIVPIYNADGHERFGAYNRINQNGPEQMGWRTNARQQNLNRDYMKAEAPETRAFLKFWNRWLPDFFVDDHVTDGADYQADVTFLADSDLSTYPPLAEWMEKTLTPELLARVNAAPGHIASQYIDFNGRTPDTGISKGQGTPRFSTGYVNMQNRPAVLIEMHMLKNYQTRVTGNYEALKAMIAIVNRDADKLVEMNRKADEETITVGANRLATPPRVHGPSSVFAGGEFPLREEWSGKTEPMEFKGYRWTVEKSAISGGEWIKYHEDQPITMTIQRAVGLKPTLSVTVPAAYIVPAEWTTVIDVLEAHGLRLQRTTKPWLGPVQMYRCRTPQWAERPFEGHHPASWQAQRRESGGAVAGDKTPRGCEPEQVLMQFPAGSVVVPADQRAFKVAMHWLEPEGPDSALQWGYFDSIFEQKEYGEGYVLERLAARMADRDPKLKAEFDQKVASDAKFAADSYARLNWWYQHSPWWDQRIGLYPVGRLSTLQGVPVE
ncbi:MAG TPA: M14 family metallopeptidase [Candidatus Acidoferrales bacterium]|nr:M14 family metallopeptidase [Candidatus Acidoferrales bacterium]